MSGALRSSHTRSRVPIMSLWVSTARPMGRSNVRTSIDRPSPAARATSSLLAWYVLTRSDALNCLSSAGKLSVWQ